MNNDLKKILRDLRRGKETPASLQLNIGEDGALKFKGQDGYTPQKGIDYWTPEEVNAITQAIFDAAKPRKGVDYYTDQDKRSFVAEVLKLATPVKGRDYRDGRDGIDGRDGKDAEEVDARKVAIDAINFLESFEGDARLSAKALKDLDEAVTEILQKGADFELSEKQITTIKDLLPKYPPMNAGGSGATFLKSLRDVDLSGLTKNADGKYVLGGGTGSSTFLALTDTPAAYTGQAGKLAAVNTGETGIEFIAPPSGSGTVDSIVAGTGISVDATDPVNPVISSPELTTEQGISAALGNNPMSYVQSRGQNLCTNGTGLLGTNYNFSLFTFDSAEAYSAKGSFKLTSKYVPCYTDEFIPITASEAYEFSAYLKWAGDQQPNHYLAMAFYDVDSLEISTRFHVVAAGGTAKTTLAQPLKPGDTVVYLTSAAGFENISSNWWLRQLGIYGYKNSGGYTYPGWTYTRNVVGYNVGAWSPGAVNFVANTITLDAPLDAIHGNPDHPNGEWPIGHPVANNINAASFKYFTSGTNTPTPTEWTKYSGVISGIDLSNNNIYTMFPPATAFGKLVFLLNRDTVNNQTTWISNVNFGLASYKGDVVGPASATDSNFAAFDTTTGKLIKDSGVSAASFAPALGADDNYVTDAEKAALATHVVGPASATDNAIARFDGTTGKLVQNSGVTIGDENIVRITNSTESGAVTALIVSGDRGTPTNNDEVIIEMQLSDSAGNQDTMATIRAQALDVTSGSEDSQLKFGTVVAGTLASRVAITGTSIQPHTDDTIALGNATENRWSDLFLASGGVINFNNGNATLTHSAGLLTSNVPVSLGTTNALTAGTIELGHASDTTISRSAAGVIAVEGVVIPSISSTNTLTNKRVTPRVSSETSSATPTINTDNVDAHSITALATAITSMTTNLSGTPTNFQKLIIRIKDNGTARAITWGASFEAKGVALPTTTVISKVLTVGFIYDTVTSKWGCVASAQEA